MVPKCQVCCNKLPKALISGDFKVTARLSMCSAICRVFSIDFCYRGLRVSNQHLNYFKIPFNKNRIRPPDTDFRAHMQNKGPRSRRCGWQSRPGPCAAGGKQSGMRPWRSPGRAVLHGHPLLKAPRGQRNCRARSESGTGLVLPEDILFLVQPFMTVAS